MVEKRKNVNKRAKSFESTFATYLTKNGIPATRVNRLGNYGLSDTDVKIDGFPEIQIDCKTRVKSSHHTLFYDEVHDRYCKKPEDRAVMPSKTKGQRGCLITITDTFFVELLKVYLSHQKNLTFYTDLKATLDSLKVKDVSPEPQDKGWDGDCG